MYLARLAWDSNQQVQSQVSHSGQFPQPLSLYQNQGPYTQSQQGSSQYQQNYQQNKSDVSNCVSNITKINKSNLKLLNYTIIIYRIHMHIFLTCGKKIDLKDLKI